MSLSSRPLVHFLAGDRVVIASWPSLGPCTVLETGHRFQELYPNRPTVLLCIDALLDRPHWFFADECLHAEDAESVQPLVIPTGTTGREEVWYCRPRTDARAFPEDSRS